jgi:hypothetical protein
LICSKRNAESEWRSNRGMASMTDRKAQLVTLRAFLMLAVITVAIATFKAIASVWPGP